jgi:hypothetical protein
MYTDSTIKNGSSSDFYLISDHRTSGVWAYPCASEDENVLLEILKTSPD